MTLVTGEVETWVDVYYDDQGDHAPRFDLNVTVPSMGLTRDEVEALVHRGVVRAINEYNKETVTQ